MSAAAASQAILYYLFDSNTRQQTGPFTHEQIVATFPQLESMPHSHILVWMTGWAGWRPVSEFMAEVRPLESVQALSPVVPGPSESVVKVGSEAEEVVHGIESAYSEKRRHARYNLKFKAMVTSEKGQHPCETFDISAGGVQLLEHVPLEVWGAQNRIRIFSPTGEEFLEFEIALTGRNQTKYFYFSEYREEDIKKLESWFIKGTTAALKRPRIKL